MSEMGQEYTPTTEEAAFERYTKDVRSDARREAAWEAIRVVHDHFNDSDLCEPVEAALERHFGFTVPLAVKGAE